jgi:hypothetical protein
MRTLQKLLEKELRNVPRQILERRLAEKFKAAGLRATKARTRRLAEYILAGNTGDIAIAKDGRDASIIVTDEDLDHVLKDPVNTKPRKPRSPRSGADSKGAGARP